MRVCRYANNAGMKRRLEQEANVLLGGLTSPPLAQDIPSLLQQAGQLDAQFQATAESYMHNESLLAFLKSLQSMPSLPAAPTDVELAEMCTVQAAPAPGVAELMQAALTAAAATGPAATATRNALGDMTAAAQQLQVAHTKSLIPQSVAVTDADGQEVALTSTEQADAMLASAAAASEVAASEAAAAAQAAADAIAEEEALRSQLAELTARENALAEAKKERDASAASPTQQALAVAEWYKTTAQELAALTGVTCLGVAPDAEGRSVASLSVSGCTSGTLEVTFTPGTPSSSATVTDGATQCVLHSVTVKGTLPLAAAAVTHLQVEALESGSLAGFVAALLSASGQ